MPFRKSFTRRNDPSMLMGRQELPSLTSRQLDTAVVRMPVQVYLIVSMGAYAGSAGQYLFVFWQHCSTAWHLGLVRNDRNREAQVGYHRPYLQQKQFSLSSSKTYARSWDRLLHSSINRLAPCVFEQLSKPCLAAAPAFCMERVRCSGTEGPVVTPVWH